MRDSVRVERADVRSRAVVASIRSMSTSSGRCCSGARARLKARPSASAPPRGAEWSAR